MSNRTVRVNELVQRELSAILRQRYQTESVAITITEVRAGLECGIKLDVFNGYQPGDVVECYEIQKVRASL